MRPIVLLLVIFNGLGFAYGQSPISWQWLHGIVKTPKDEVVAGVTLHFGGTETNYTSSNINGEFEIRLKPGEYDLSIAKYDLPNYRLHLKITDGPLNPDNIRITIDPEKYCCLTASDSFPKPITIPKSIYPAAARATRATGEVFVDVEIGKDGTVISAKALAGRPLLQRAAEMAARSARFEASEGPQPRTAVITYVFLARGKPRPELQRYANPYRIEMMDDTEVIDTVSADPGNKRSFLFHLKKFFRLF
jgi:TonB family protein